MPCLFPNFAHASGGRHESLGLPLSFPLPSSEIPFQATKDLQAAYKRPEAVTELCNVAVNSANFQVRQYSFVLLRRRFAKLRNWQLVTKDVQENIKVGMLKALVGEPDKPVRSAIAQFIGVLCRHEFPKKDPWCNDLLKFVFESCANGDSHQSEVRASTSSWLFIACRLVPNYIKLIIIINATLYVSPLPLSSRWAPSR